MLPAPGELLVSEWSPYPIRYLGRDGGYRFRDYIATGLDGEGKDFTLSEADVIKAFLEGTFKKVSGW